jgi:hypothetical protein
MIEYGTTPPAIPFEGKDPSYFAGHDIRVISNATGDSRIPAIIEAVTPVVDAVVEKLGGIVLGPIPEKKSIPDKAIPDADEATAALDHLVPAKILPKLKRGGGRRDLNKGNPHDSSYDPEDPESLTLYEVAIRNGKASIPELVAATGLPRDAIVSLPVYGMHEIIDEDGVEVFNGIQLAACLQELDEKQFPTIDMLTAPDLETFVESDSYKAFLTAQAERETTEAEENIVYEARANAAD